MSTRTITHIAVSPEATGGHPPSSEELTEILNTYLTTEHDPNGGVLTTRAGVTIRQYEIQVGSERELLEQHIISLALRCFQVDPGSGVTAPEHHVAAVLALGRVVQKYRESGYVGSRYVRPV